MLKSIQTHLHSKRGKVTTLLDETKVTYIFDSSDGRTELETEISFLKNILKDHQSKEEDRGMVQLYKTALRIAKIRRKWEKDPNHLKNSFSQFFYIGFRKKKLVRIYCVGNLWFSSPDNYACAIHNVLARIPQKSSEVEW